jgi:YfiR/HmsC-like
MSRAPRHVIGRLGPLLALVLGCWLAPAQGARADASRELSPEYLIKAAYLYNFALFVEWPSTAFARADSPIVIGVVGVDPFGAALDQTVKDKSINTRSIEVRRLQATQDLSRCHILFVSASESARISEVAQRVGGRSVLVVGDTAGLTTQGATITFAVKDNRVRLEVNVDSARRSRLTISSKLLNLATIVRGP